MSMHELPGGYVLVVGSGISLGSSVPSGWGVMEMLTRQLASLDGEDLAAPGFDVQKWWAKRYPNTAYEYGAILEASGKSKADRRNLLEPCFVASAQDKAEGKKQPAPAHRAIAELVVRGAIKVIVTTNFDDLLEQAIRDVGVAPQIITTAGQIENMDPLHSRMCTIIKVHGDYKSAWMLNTESELRAYESDQRGLLHRIFNEYPVIVSGWSADFDEALVEAIATAKVRYPLYWGTVGSLGRNALSLVDARAENSVIDDSYADVFFPQILAKLKVLDTDTAPSDTVAASLAAFKRAIRDPAGYPEELIDGEVKKLRNFLLKWPLISGDATDSGVWQDALIELLGVADTLMRLVVAGIVNDRARSHDELWFKVITRLMSGIPRDPGFQSYDKQWTHLTLLPAFMLLKAASHAAIIVDREELFIRLHIRPQLPTAKESLERYLNMRSVSAVRILYDVHMLEAEAGRAALSLTSERWVSTVVRRWVEPVLLACVDDDRASFEKLADRVEFRATLLHQFVLPDWSERNHSFASGLHTLDHFDRTGRWIVSDDFVDEDKIGIWVEELELESREYMLERIERFQIRAEQFIHRYHSR